ncbi:MAG: hypothetical protein AAF996_18225 [Pseudomonadota bacterium]
MDKIDIEACLDALEDLFEQEANNIVSGNLSELGEIAQAKVQHLSALSAAIEGGALRDQPQTVIVRIQKLQHVAAEHDQHLQAVRYGLSRTLERLDRIQSDANVGSYNKSGGRVQFSDARGRFESKA